MAKVRFLSITEQVTQHLRKEITRGSYGEVIPGVRRIAEDLDVDMKTVNSALKALEAEGLLLPQGAGRQRRVNPHEKSAKTHLRIEILLFERNELNVSYHIDMRHRLESAGHAVSFATKTLEELGLDVGRVARYVRSVGADAWVVTAGSREILKWFSEQAVPAFALFGRFSTIPIAGIGPDKTETMATAVEHLVKLGHRRIVMLSREARRKPVPAAMERQFLKTLQDMKVPVGTYNLPDWEETRQGYYKLLDSLFKHTPPTALIIDGTTLFFAAQTFLAQRGLRSPHDVSLISLDPHPFFEWSEPEVSHFSWDSRPWVKRVVNWAGNVARGKEDKRQMYTQTEFVVGGTVGPAPSILSNG